MVYENTSSVSTLVFKDFTILPIHENLKNTNFIAKSKKAKNGKKLCLQVWIKKIENLIDYNYIGANS